MGPNGIDIVPWLQFGMAGAFLALLFLGLRSGAIYTKSAVDKIVALYERSLQDKDKYIDKLETINKLQDERNDLLASKIEQILEVSRAQGMIAALPPQTVEKVL